MIITVINRMNQETTVVQVKQRGTIVIPRPVRKVLKIEDDDYVRITIEKTSELDEVG